MGQSPETSSSSHTWYISFPFLPSCLPVFSNFLYTLKLPITPMEKPRQSIVPSGMFTLIKKKDLPRTQSSSQITCPQQAWEKPHFRGEMRVWGGGFPEPRYGEDAQE